MTEVDQPVTPMRRVLAVLGTFAAGCVAAVSLWMWWSDRCGEDCPSPNVVHMLVFLGLLPTVSGASAVLLVSTSWSGRVKTAVGGVIAVGALIVGALVARLPGG